MKRHKVFFAVLQNFCDTSQLSNETYSFTVTKSLTAFVTAAVSLSRFYCMYSHDEILPQNV
jgi:hypothetical protein